MSLDPDAELVLGMIRASGRPPVQALSPQQAREVYRASRKAVTPEPPDVAQVDDLAAPGPGGAMALRMYRGLGSSGTLPVLVSFMAADSASAIWIPMTTSAARLPTTRDARSSRSTIGWRRSTSSRRRSRTVRLRWTGWVSRRSSSGSIGRGSRLEATAQAAICPP